MDIRIPNLGEGADSGSVVNIFVKEGDKVAKDQTLIELENEKAVAPIPSTHNGVVTKLLVKLGDKVTVGQAIVSLAEDPSQPKMTVAAQPPAPSYNVAPVASGAEPAASPSIRKMARELNIDLRLVRGTESGGRIGMADLRNYISKHAAESVDFSKWGPVHKKALSSLRQKIGQKMTESWTTIPHVTQFEEADITSLMELRKKYVEAYEKKGAKLTLTSFVLKAVVAALKKYPQFNASLDENTQEIVTKDYFHLGVAVDTEAGLIVPVLKDVDKKDLVKISQELEELAEKTRARKVSLDELKGGSFTVSNLGGIGGTFFTPIINKPELAILGVGRGVLKPVAMKDKSIQTRLMLPLALSYDHRVIDGADGARFIRATAEALENFSEKEVSLRGA